MRKKTKEREDLFRLFIEVAKKQKQTNKKKTHTQEKSNQQGKGDLFLIPLAT